MTHAFYHPTHILLLLVYTTSATGFLIVIYTIFLSFGDGKFFFDVFHILSQVANLEAEQETEDRARAMERRKEREARDEAKKTTEAAVVKEAAENSEKTA